MVAARDRFNIKTRRHASGCLVWTGATSNGYPMFRYDGKLTTARRWAWESVHGDSSDINYIYMNCRNQTCVEVKHMTLKNTRQKVSKLPYLKG